MAMSSSKKSCLLQALLMISALAVAAAASSGQPSPGASATANLTLHNLCPYPVWPLVTANSGVPSIPTDADGEPVGRLDGNGEGLATLAFPAGAWSGRVVARTGCAADEDGDEVDLGMSCGGRRCSMRHLGQMNSIMPGPTARTSRHPAQRTCTGAAAGDGDEPPAIGGDRSARVSGQGSGVSGLGLLPRSRRAGEKPKRRSQWVGWFGPVFEDFEAGWVPNGNQRLQEKNICSVRLSRFISVFYENIFSI